MPDSFFSAHKTARKRKREDSLSHKAGPSGAKKKLANKTSTRTNGTSTALNRLVSKKTKGKAVDEELSDGSDDVGPGAIDEMDLRGDAGDDLAQDSGEEDDDETPAEKRLRLAKLYLESVKEGLGVFPFLFFYFWCGLTNFLGGGEQRKESLTQRKLTRSSSRQD